MSFKNRFGCLISLRFYWVNCRYEIWQHVGSTDRSLWNNGTTCYIELFLSKIHVLVPIVYGYWYFMPLALHANVSITHNNESHIIRHFVSISNKNFSLIMLSSTMQGKTSHKFFDPNENFIMRLYYQKDVLTFMCFCNEMFYSGMYLLYFTSGPTCKLSINDIFDFSINILIFINFNIIKSVCFSSSIGHLAIQSTYNYRFPSGNCKVRHLPITCLRGRSKSVHHRFERTRRESKTWCS